MAQAMGVCPLAAKRGILQGVMVRYHAFNVRFYGNDSC